MSARAMLVGFAWVASAVGLAAQTPTPPPIAPPPAVPEAKKATLPPPPAPTAVAATVNGQEILEVSVYRAFLNEPANYTPENRRDLVNHLVDNLLVDQYLFQMKVPVDQKDVDERFAQIEAEAKKNKQELKDMLAKLQLTENDLRKELLGSARWEKFLAAQATDKALRDMFAANPAMFNGTMVQARHVLLGKGPGAEQQAVALRTAIDKQVSDELIKAQVGADPILREKERVAILLRTFTAVATEYSQCPSKKKGGDLGYFPRIGAMVEPFSKAAFALKPFEVSQPVQTEFGFHLILATDHRAGKEVRFEEVRPIVQEVYGERLREAIVAAYKPKSKIVVNDPK